MVKLALPLAALAMAASVVAAPAGTSATTFSFEQWVEDIMANPDTALTADEAIEAAQAAEVVGSAGGLQKRSWTCWDELNFPRAPGRDAAACADNLARKGNNGVMCSLGPSDYTIQMCRIGGARIQAGKPSDNRPQSTNCNDVARAIGRVFDNCWRADDTVMGGDMCTDNDEIWINVLGL